MSSHLPSYKKIASIITERIYKGLYPPSTYLPSENKLSEEFSVTRATIRKALNILKQQETIESFKGKGYRVKTLYWEQSLLQFYSFGRNIAGKVKDTRTELISCNIINGLYDIEEFKEQKLREITRLRLIEDIPVIMETSYIPEQYLSDISEEVLLKESLYDLLEASELSIVRAREYLEPVYPSVEACKYLKVNEETPLFQTKRYTYDTTDRLVEFRDSLIRGDKFRFSVEMTL